jgi:hypothetical protein
LKCLVGHASLAKLGIDDTGQMIMPKGGS